MRLPVIEAIRSEVLGNKPSPILPGVFMTHHSEATPVSDVTHDQHCEYFSSVEVCFKQIAPAGAAQYVRESAIQALSHRIYQPVSDEIREALIELRAMGVMPDAPAYQRLAKMLPVLEGQSVTEQ